MELSPDQTQQLWAALQRLIRESDAPRTTKTEKKLVGVKRSTPARNTSRASTYVLPNAKSDPANTVVAIGRSMETPARATTYASDSDTVESVLQTHQLTRLADSLKELGVETLEDLLQELEFDDLGSLSRRDALDAWVVVHIERDRRARKVPGRKTRSTPARNTSQANTYALLSVKSDPANNAVVPVNTRLRTQMYQVDTDNKQADEDAKNESGCAVLVPVVAAANKIQMPAPSGPCRGCCCPTHPSYDKLKRPEEYIVHALLLLTWGSAAPLVPTACCGGISHWVRQLVKWIWRILVISLLWIYWISFNVTEVQTMPSLQNPPKPDGSSDGLNYSGLLVMVNIYVTISFIIINGLFMFWWIDHHSVEFARRFWQSVGPRDVKKFRIWFYSVIGASVTVCLTVGNYIGYFLYSLYGQDVLWYNTMYLPSLAGGAAHNTVVNATNYNTTAAASVPATVVLNMKMYTDWYGGRNLTVPPGVSLTADTPLLEIYFAPFWSSPGAWTFYFVISIWWFNWYWFSQTLTSAMWTLELLIFHWSFRGYIRDELSWHSINSGRARQVFTRAVTRFQEINSTWSLRTTITLMYQLAVIVLGYLSFINEIQMCEDLGFAKNLEMLQCKALTPWLHIITVFVSLNVILDFYYAGYIADNFQQDWVNSLHKFELDLEDAPELESGPPELSQPNHNKLRTLKFTIKSEGFVGIKFCGLQVHTGTPITIVVQLIAFVVIIENVRQQDDVSPE